MGKFVIGVDTGITVKDRLAYCLVDVNGGNPRVILTKSYPQEESKEFNNLVKYFNATKL